MQTNKQGSGGGFSINQHVDYSTAKIHTLTMVVSAIIARPHKLSLKLLCAYEPGDVILSAVVVSGSKISS